MYKDINRRFWEEFEKDSASFISLGLVKEEYIGKFSRLLDKCKHIGISSAALILRKQGELLGKDELKSIGLSVKVKLGRDYIASLTNEGLASPLDTATFLCYANLLLKEKSENLNNFRQPRFPISVRIVHTHNSGRICCKKVSELSDQKFEVNNTPKLPLEDCDKWCACAYVFERRN